MATLRIICFQSYVDTLYLPLYLPPPWGDQVNNPFTLRQVLTVDRKCIWRACWRRACTETSKSRCNASVSVQGATCRRVATDTQIVCVWMFAEGCVRACVCVCVCVCACASGVLKGIDLRRRGFPFLQSLRLQDAPCTMRHKGNTDRKK